MFSRLTIWQQATSLGDNSVLHKVRVTGENNYQLLETRDKHVGVGVTCDFKGEIEAISAVKQLSSVMVRESPLPCSCLLLYILGTALMNFENFSFSQLMSFVCFLSLN